MKPGSLVVVIDQPEANGHPDIKWLPVGDSETIYTVRKIEESPDEQEPGVMFEEGFIGYNSFTGQEFGVFISFVKEIQPPEEVSISALMEEVNEMELFVV